MCDQQLKEFSFEVYNTSGSGVLNVTELHEAVSLFMSTPNTNDDSIPKLMSLSGLTNLEPTYEMSVSDYLTHIQNFPIFLYPILTTQMKLRTTILGETFWLKRQAAAIHLKKMPHIVDMFAVAYQTQKRQLTTHMNGLSSDTLKVLPRERNKRGLQAPHRYSGLTDHTAKTKICQDTVFCSTNNTLKTSSRSTPNGDSCLSRGVRDRSNNSFVSDENSDKAIGNRNERGW